MQIGPKNSEAPLKRKSSMVNIWLGKQLGPELDVDAVREEKESGRATSRIDLAREIFIWAYGIYKQAGSLKALKLMTAEDFIRGTEIETFSEKNAITRAASRSEPKAKRKAS